jgi:hypothetical protein
MSKLVIPRVHVHTSESFDGSMSMLPTSSAHEQSIRTHTKACSSAGISQHPYSQHSQHSNMYCQKQTDWVKAVLSHIHCYAKNNARLRNKVTGWSYWRFRVYAAPQKLWETTWHTEQWSMPATAYKRKILTVLSICSPNVLYISESHKNTCQCSYSHGHIRIQAKVIDGSNSMQPTSSVHEQIA